MQIFNKGDREQNISAALFCCAFKFFIQMLFLMSHMTCNENIHIACVCVRIRSKTCWMPCLKGRWIAGTTSSDRATTATTFTSSTGIERAEILNKRAHFGRATAGNWRNIIVSSCRGAFHIYVASENEPSPRLVGQYEGSGSFGELALMYNMPRAATVQVRKISSTHPCG